MACTRAVIALNLSIVACGVAPTETEEAVTTAVVEASPAPVVPADVDRAPPLLAAPAEGDLLQSKLQMTPTPDRDERGPLTVSLAGCQTPDCPLVFTFSHPVVVPALVPPTPTFLHLDPAIGASFVWRSASELVVQPDPGALNWGHRLEVRIDPIAALDAPNVQLDGAWKAEVQVPHLEIGGKVASWPVQAGKPRVVAFLDGAARQIGRAGVHLLYDQPVEPAAIAETVTAFGPAGKRLGLRVRRTDFDFGVPIDPAYLVTARIRRLPAHGQTVRLVYPSHEGGRSAAKERDLEVNSRLTMTELDLEADSSARVPIDVRWTALFNNPVSPSGLQDALQLSPSPRSLHVSAWGAEATIVATFAPGTLYRLEIPKTLEDQLGNRLGTSVTRKFRTADVSPQLKIPDGPYVLERSDAELPVAGVNVRNLQASFHAFDDPAAFVRALVVPKRQRCRDFRGAAAKGAGLPAVRWRVRLNKAFRKALPLPAKRLTGPGCIELSATGRGSEAPEGAMSAAILVQPSHLGLTAKVHDGGILVWVTRLADASGVAGGLVSVLTGDGETIAEAKTDEHGLAEVAAADVTTVRGLSRAVYVRASDDEGDVLVALDDKRLSRAWQFDLPAAVGGAGALTASIFTDRGVYRPEETAHVVLIARDPRGLGVPQDHMFELQIRDPRGKTIVDRVVTVDRFGAADVEVPLAAGAAVGKYAILATQSGNTKAHHFSVEEYRVPTFEVRLGAEPKRWTAGAEATVSITGAYHHGGALAGRAASYQVVRVPHRFSAPGFAGFTFTPTPAPDVAGQLSSGEGKLDGSGRLAFSFTPQHPPSAGPMRYVIGASVTDVDRQSYAGRLSRVVHPADLYVGVKPPGRAIVAAALPLEVPVIVADVHGQLVPGVEVKITAAKIEHHTIARWSADEVERLNRAVITSGGGCKARSGATAVSCRLRLDGAGAYRVHAVTTDRAGRVVTSGFDVTATGDNATAWPRFDHERIDVIADRPAYSPGDVARLVVESPFASARGLLTLERAGVLEHRLFEISGDTPAIEVPITAAHAPNVYASVVLVRGRVHDAKDASGFATGAPAFRMGYAELKVEPKAHRLDVRIDPAKHTAHPKETLDLAIHVRDAAGRPSAGQAVVMVVDEAVLQMTRYQTPDPVADLFSRRPLGVRTGSSRLDLPNARRARRELIFPGGDGTDDPLSDLPADLRSFFASTAFFDATVPIAVDGTGSVRFELPDNVTRYRVMAVVASDGSATGAGAASLTVRKPLIVQPVLPRFVYPGDELRVEAMAFNGTERAGEVELSAVFVGFERGDQSPDRAMTVGAGASQKVGYDVLVTGAKTAKVRFTAKMGEHEDTVQVEIPILDPGNRRTVVEQRRVADADTVELTLPPDRIAGSERMEVVVSTTMLSALSQAVGYVMGYPHGCIEQTTSRAYPLVMLDDLLDDIGVDVDREKLKTYAAAGIARLLSFQTSEGGLSYWPGGTRPHAFGTVFGLTALIEGKKKGYDVPDEALQKMAAYLERSLASGTITGEMPHGGMADADTRALIVLTLARLGRPKPSAVASLWQHRAAMTPFGMSMLAVAVQEGAGDPALLAPLLAAVKDAAVVAADEAHFAGGSKGGWSFDSPLRTHASALLAYAPSGAAIGNKLLTGLLDRKVGGMWGNTQENVFGIMGVAALARQANAGAAPKMALTVNGDRISSQRMAAVTKRMHRLELSSAQIAGPAGLPALQAVSLKNRGAGPMFLTVRAEYAVALDADNRAPTANGFEIGRVYETTGGRQLEGSIPLGSVVRVRLKVRADAKRNYVAVQDNLPAGLEPLNANLATTAGASLGALSPAASRAMGALSYQEIRDASVAFYIDDMPAGDYELVYLARATTPGAFLRPAARAEAMYAPGQSGTTAIDEVEIR